MPDEYVTDTHSLYWYLTASTKLGVNARAIFGRADMGDCILSNTIVNRHDRQDYILRRIQGGHGDCVSELQDMDAGMKKVTNDRN